MRPQTHKSRSMWQLWVVLFIAMGAIGAPLRSSLADTAKLEPLSIETQSGIEEFQVEIADTDEARQQGLMYRRSMPERQGMLFNFFRNERVSFWMKNTYLPLDMIFIAEGGEVKHIHEWATPESLKSISPPVPVQAVLELLGGSAQRFGIRPGDQVRHRIFTPR